MSQPHDLNALTNSALKEIEHAEAIQAALQRNVEMYIVTRCRNTPRSRPDFQFERQILKKVAGFIRPFR